ncbi:MAG: acyltransferase [Gemmatimonadetes bacterium]|nr:acyltransferase [Gemmatimonadota bacterium]
MSDTRRLDLDGLRGLAVLLVVGFHAGIPALAGAFVAVDVFFVLSGFFLAIGLARRLATGEEIRPLELWAQRLWRLLPFVVVMLLGTLASTLLYAPIDRATVARHMIPVSAFAGNLAFAADGVNYFRAGENPLLHTWTLGVELQLALLVPVLVAGLAAWGVRRAGDATTAERRVVVTRTVLLGLVLVSAASLALAVILNDRAPMWAYFGPHTRLWSFCAGVLMAFVIGGGQSLVGHSPSRVTLLQGTGLALLLVPAFLVESTLAYPGMLALAPVGGTMCLLAGGGIAAASPLGRVLASAPLTALGRVSYGWYLWHWPLIVLGGVLVPTVGVVGKLAWGASGLLAAVLTQRLLQGTGTVAWWQGAVAGRPMRAAVAVCAGLALVAAGAASLSDRHVRTSVHQQFQAAREDQVGHACWGSSVAVDEGCAYGAVDAPTTIALLGDSHASHWIGGLDLAGRDHQWRIEPHVMGACPVADLRGLIDGAVARLYEQCAEYQEATMRRLEAEPPQAVILSNADFYLKPQAGRTPGIPESTWVEGLRRTYTRLARLGIPVVAFRALPWVPFDVPSCLSRREARLLLATECVFSPDRAFMARGRSTQDEAARGLPVRFVDLNDAVCGDTGSCATTRDGIILYTDDNHITRGLSRTLAPTLGERVSRALAP